LKPVQVIFRFGPSKEYYRLMMYRKNRLIKAYERIDFQKQNTSQSIGVVGVVELDFLEAIHNKQDFNQTDRYNAAMSVLAQTLNDYWHVKIDTEDLTIENATTWTWVHCVT